MKRFRRLATALALAAGLPLLVAGLLGAAPAAAETAAEFYQGKVVKLVVGYGPGGGYDLYARLLAPHLERRLGATVVVENRPGGGGMVAISQLASGEGDGLTLVLANLEAAALGQVLDSAGIRFDVRTLPVLARVGSDPKVVLLGTGSPFRSIADLQAADRPVRWSGGGKTDAIADNAAVLSHALGLRAEIIIGYKGGKESALAAARGEADGMVISDGTARTLIAGGELAAVAVLSRERSTLLPDVPTVFEAVTIGDGQARWLDYRAGLTELGRTLITAPGTPEDRLAVLRQAVDSVLTDPDVLAEAEAIKRPIRYASHRTVERWIADTVGALDAAAVAGLRDIILKKYY